MKARIVDIKNLRDISSELLMSNGKLKLFTADEYRKYKWEELRMFCHFHSRYGLPTKELVKFLNVHVIKDRSAIEIGSGHGDLGYHLQIPMTDSKVQQLPEIKFMYEAMGGQPTINYPNDIEQLEASAAIEKYKPKVVIASWVTEKAKPDIPYGFIYGIEEDEIIDSVDTYVLIGNAVVHKDKSVFKRKHIELPVPFLVSRAQYQDKNRIYIWDKSNV